ncbi:BQ5605_C031g10964 [Microbotryum silenes-dioicae]|uniref:BQ5605_C031g10964 protein n=1 Tax=Microbotryum silenes-dioicae TaxID=796604 RepID=A0A2X0MKE0_9BASI|nr:BQ5605_C031g10964 [Microbotryum silenes-dioicae]
MVFPPPNPSAVPPFSSSASSLPASGTAPVSARPALGQLDVNRAPNSSSSSSSQPPHRSLSPMTSKDKLKQWTFPRNGSPVLPSPPDCFPSTGTNNSHSTPLMGYSLSDDEANAQSFDPQSPVIIESRTNQYDRHVRRNSQDDERSSGSDGGIESPCGASSSIPFMQKRSDNGATNKPSPSNNGTKQQHKTTASTFRHRGKASVAVVPISSPENSPSAPGRPGLTRVTSSPRQLTNPSANNPPSSSPEPMEFPTSPSELIRMIYANLRRRSLQDFAWALVFGVCLLLFASALTGHGYAPPELDLDLSNQDRVEASATFLPKGGQYRDLPMPADVHQPTGDDSHDVGHDWMKDSPDDRRLDDEHVHHQHEGPDALFEGDHSVAADDHDHSHINAVLDDQKPGRKELEELDTRTVEMSAGVDVTELTQEDDVAEVAGNDEEEHVQVQGEEEHGDGAEADEGGEEEDVDGSVQDEVEHDHEHGSGGLHLEPEPEAEDEPVSFSVDAKNRAVATDLPDQGPDGEVEHSIQYGEDVQALRVKRMLKQRRRR